VQRYEIAGDIRMRIFIVCATISLQAQALPVAAASANKEIELFDKVGGWYLSNNHLTVYNGGSGYLRVEIKNVNYMSGSINWYVETSGDTWDNRFAVPTSPKNGEMIIEIWKEPRYLLACFPTLTYPVYRITEAGEKVLIGKIYIKIIE
jgi:hypothetical protein